MLLVAYALGLGVPFLAVLLVYRRIRPVSVWLTARARGVEVVTGGLIAAVGVLIYDGSFGHLAGLFRFGAF